MVDGFVDEREVAGKPIGGEFLKGAPFVAGSAALAAQSPETPDVLRQRVTSKGGTTYAALTSMEDHGVKPARVRAMHAAARRAHELGDEFGQG